MTFLENKLTFSILFYALLWCSKRDTVMTVHANTCQLTYIVRVTHLQIENIDHTTHNSGLLVFQNLGTILLACYLGLKRDI